MRANLTPTQVTDVNGRVTTVHKRLDAAQKPSKGAGVPAPSLAPTAPSSAHTATPITLPEPLSEEQLSEFYKWQQPFQSQVRYRSEVMAVMDKPFDGPTQALAWKIISEGSVPHSTVFQIISKYHSRRQSQLAKMFGFHQKELLDSLRNRLLLAERVAQKVPQDASSEYWFNESFISKAMEGYHYKPKEEDRKLPQPIASDEELESIATVTSFLLKARIAGNIDQFREKNFRTANGKQAEGIYLANKSLDAYLRGAPDDAPRAIDYAVTRNIGNTMKDTKQLMTYLKDTEDAVAINEGWL